MKKVTKCASYKAPKLRFATLKRDCGFAMSDVSGRSTIDPWSSIGGLDGADD